MKKCLAQNVKVEKPWVKPKKEDFKRLRKVIGLSKNNKLKQFTHSKLFNKDYKSFKTVSFIC